MQINTKFSLGDEVSIDYGEYRGARVVKTGKVYTVKVDVFDKRIIVLYGIDAKRNFLREEKHCKKGDLNAN